MGDLMRLRNIKGSKEIVAKSDYVVNDYKEYKGKWKELFNNNNPIYLEIGIGKGQYLINSALKNPNINYIGIEKYDTVLLKAIKKLNDQQLSNLKIISCDAKDINDIFDKEIDTILLNFSDPWKKERHSKRRLTSEIFLNKYKDIFISDNHIIMKTDNINLFEFSIETLSQYGYIFNDISLDLHNSKNKDIITTEYEDKFIEKGNAICFLDAYKKDL